MNKKLVVGILNHMRGIEICLLLQSLISQTYQNFDIIIIDDNPNNFLYENQVVQGLIQLHINLNHVTKIIKGERKGPSFAGQKLFENAKDYEFVLRLDDDVTLEKDCIENLIKFFDDISVSAVGPIYLSPYKRISEQILNIDEYQNYLEFGKIYLIDDNHVYVNGILNSTIPINLKTNFIEVEHLHSGFLYRRKDVENIGEYYLGYSRVAFREESDLSHRLYLNGGKLLISTEAIAFHYHTIGGIYLGDDGQLSDKDLWESDEKIFIERFKNKFKDLNIQPQILPQINPKNIRPDIQLITVTYGDHEKLKKLIESVFKYTNNFKWQIINNDPSEKSHQLLDQILKDYQNISYLNLNKEISVSEARNIGVENGLLKNNLEYICFVDDDALILGKWSEDDWLDLLYKKLHEEKDIGAVSPIYTWFDPLKSYVLSVACLFTSIKIWKQVGGFDQLFGNKKRKTWGHEDTEWSHRLQSMGYKIKGIEACGFPFYHEDTTFKKKLEWQENGLEKARELLLSKYDIKKISEFSRMSYPFTSDQMQIRGKKLNIGSYYAYFDGFINIDINSECRPDIIGDIRNLDFKDNSIELILASQIIEHFDLIDVKELLAKFHRWLISGGFLIIEVPDVGYILNKVEAGEWKLEDYDFAINGNDKILGMKHKSIFDINLLANMLKEAGFRNLERREETSENDEITIRIDSRKE